MGKKLHVKSNYVGKNVLLLKWVANVEQKLLQSYSSIASSPQ